MTKSLCVGTDEKRHSIKIKGDLRVKTTSIYTVGSQENQYPVGSRVNLFETSSDITVCSTAYYGHDKVNSFTTVGEFTIPKGRWIIRFKPDIYCGSTNNGQNVWFVSLLSDVSTPIDYDARHCQWFRCENKYTTHCRLSCDDGRRGLTWDGGVEWPTLKWYIAAAKDIAGTDIVLKAGSKIEAIRIG